MSAQTGWRFVKLVRDGIVRYHLGEDGYRYVLMKDPRKVRAKLRAKLVEEAAEYAVEPSAEELADVLAVVKALAQDHGGMAYVAEVEMRKEGERGGFYAGTGMYVSTSGPDGTALGG